MKQTEITRKQYQAIKRMDHNGMKDYISRIADSAYDAGYRDGQKSVPASFLSHEELCLLLQDIKGVGKQKAEAIAEVLLPILRGEADG